MPNTRVYRLQAVAISWSAAGLRRRVASDRLVRHHYVLGAASAN